MSEQPAGRVVVLDDDPTGTQGVSDLPVVLHPDLETLGRTAGQCPGALWVLTNTRAMPEAAAAALLRQIAADVRFGGRTRHAAGAARGLDAARGTCWPRSTPSPRPGRWRCSCPRSSSKAGSPYRACTT